MRPAGEIRAAILQAAGELRTDDRAPTIQELAARACVGLEATRRTVDNMKRCGILHSPRTRKVGYRNRPVAEYEPAPLLQTDITGPTPGQEVARALALWVLR